MNLRSMFSQAGRRVYGQVRAVLTRSKSGEDRQEILARSQYRFRLVSLAAVPRAHRMAALQAQLTAWGPFPEASYLVELRGDSVHAVAFPRHLAGYPEGFCVAAPASDGIRLLECRLGVEAQFWLGGAMQVSRWWAELPSLEQWLNFQRGARIPEVFRLDVVPAPIIRFAEGERASRSRLVPFDKLILAPRRREALLLAIGSYCLFALTTWLGMEWLVLDEEARRLNSEHGRQQSIVGAVEKARDETLKNAQLIQSIASANSGDSPLMTIAFLSQNLPDEPFVTREVEIRDHQVTIGLNPPERSSREVYLAALDAGKWLGNPELVSLSNAMLGVRAGLGTALPPLREPKRREPPRSAGETLQVHEQVSAPPEVALDVPDQPRLDEIPRARKLPRSGGASAKTANKGAKK